MTEGGDMPGPEQEKILQPEGKAQQAVSFRDKLIELIKPQAGLNSETGQQEEQPPILINTYLKGTAERISNDPLISSETLLDGHRNINDWLGKKLEKVEDGLITKEDYDQVEKQARILKEIIFEEIEQLAEQTSEDLLIRRREFLMGQNLPPYLGAVFSLGSFEGDIRSGAIIEKNEKGEVVNHILDVRKERDREEWLLRNTEAAMSEEVIFDPERKWKVIVEAWMADFNLAVRRANESIEGDDSGFITTEMKKEFEKKIRSAMAICASARAMEQSNGSAELYVGYMTNPENPEHPNLERKDDWTRFLLHGDRSKIRTLLENKLVRKYYQTLMSSVGINSAWDEESGVFNWDGEIDKSIFYEQGKGVFDKASLAYYLVSDDDGRYRGGINSYIEEVLMENEKNGFSRAERWGAAKLACDLFLVDSFTKWEYRINKEGQIEKTGFKPSAAWGGDPFRAILEPSFLPKRIKGVYSGRLSPEDEFIFDKIDKAFRPDDIFSVVQEDPRIKPLEASATIDLKAYSRWSAALWKFLGGSRADGVPKWDQESCSGLKEIAELLDQVYGGQSEDHPRESKHVVAAMMARIINIKAFAITMERLKPGFREKALIFLGHGIEETRPFLNAETFIWGPKLDASSGFIRELSGSRTNFAFKDNKYGAELELHQAAEILFASGRDKEEIRQMLLLNSLGYLWDVFVAIGRNIK
ncbi:MAG: hypothetical protein PHX72_00080 [Candidatus Shapirobacteria bacterium]|nr:hypothetical protein [Candidatus Shapirobacteria bacterium]